MTTIRQFFKKTVRVGQTSLAAVATVGMLAVFAPTTGQANGIQHLSSNLSGVAQVDSSNIENVQVRGRGFRGSRGFRGGRSFRGGNRSFRGGSRSFRGSSRGFRSNRGFRGGSFLAGSIIGLTAGSIISNSGKHYHGHSSSNFSADYIAACSRKYRSFNPNTGRYLAYSGKYRRCKL
ncbi:MAG: BA14K family protein [Hyphomicrobiales bacterium]